MPKPETRPAFYQHHLPELPALHPSAAGQVNVFRLEEARVAGAPPVPYSRRDFYKIALTHGHHLYHYADKSLEVRGPALLFFNPQVPYSCQPLSARVTGFYCLFAAEFFRR